MSIAHVVSSASATGTNDATTTGVDTTGANLLVLVVTSYVGGTPSISDSKSNTWTALTARTTGSDNRTRLYYCAAPTVGSAHTFTVSGSGTYVTLAAVAFSGAATSPYDQETGYATSAGGATIQPGSLTPSENNCVIVSGTAFGAGTASSSIDSSFAEYFDRAGSSGVNYTSAGAYLIQTTAGAVNPTITANASATYKSTALASFKAAAGSGGTGSLAQTLAALTSSAAGTLPIVGTAAPTLAALTSSATATLPIVGTAAPTLAALTSSATATLPIVGAAAPTLAALTSSATGTLPIVGAAAPTLAALTVSATGTAVEGPAGTVAATLAALTATVTGVLPIVGGASATLGALTASATGRVAIAAQLGITLGDLVFSASGTGATLSPIVGALSATLGALAVAATGAEFVASTPAERTLQILAESRALRIAAESRALQIDAEQRTLRITPS